MLQILSENVKSQADLYEVGYLVAEGLKDSVRNSIGSLMHTLHFEGCLQQPSKRVDRVSGGGVTTAFRIVGLKMVSDIPIKVPRIPIGESKDAELVFKVLTYIDVPAGVPFYLTYLEFMFLVSRPEYAGYFKCYDTSQNATLCFRTAKFLKGEQGIPTPTIRFLGQGSPKEVVVDVEYFDEDNKCWCIYPEFQEQFGYLQSKGRVKRRYTLDKGVKTESQGEWVSLNDYLMNVYNFTPTEVVSLPEAKTHPCSTKDESQFNVLELTKTTLVILSVCRYLWDTSRLDFGWNF